MRAPEEISALFVTRDVIRYTEYSAVPPSGFAIAAGRTPLDPLAMALWDLVRPRPQLPCLIAGPS